MATAGYHRWLDGCFHLVRLAAKVQAAPADLTAVSSGFARTVAEAASHVHASRVCQECEGEPEQTVVREMAGEAQSPLAILASRPSRVRGADFAPSESI